MTTAMPTPSGSQLFDLTAREIDGLHKLAKTDRLMRSGSMSFVIKFQGATKMTYNQRDYLRVLINRFLPGHGAPDADAQGGE